MKEFSYQHFDTQLEEVKSEIKENKKDSAIQLAIEAWIKRLSSSGLEFDPELTKQIRKGCESIVSKEKLEEREDLKHPTLGQNKKNKYHKIALTARMIVDYVIITILNKNRIDEVYNDRVSDQGKPKTNFSRTTITKPEYFIFTVVVYENEKKLLEELQTNKRLTPETANLLKRAKQWVGYSSETEFNKNCRNLFKSASDNEPSEYDVRFVKIMLNQPDERLSNKSSLLEMSDAFKDLGNQQVTVEVSPRHPKESYENKGFYRL